MTVNPLLRLMRSQPHVYSASSKARLFYSRYFAARRERMLYRGEREVFAPSEIERGHSLELRERGFTVLHDFFDTALIDRIFAKADSLFRSLQIEPGDSYSIRKGERSTFEGLTYESLERTEKMISLRDPLLNVPEAVDLALHPTILKIVTNFLGYVVPWYKALIVRDFPAERPRESSNFHKDNDEADSVQVFVYLVDIDETTVGSLIYIPGTNHYDVRSCRPRLSRDLGLAGFDGRISDEEVLKYYPQQSWFSVRARRGSIAIIHGNGLHKGPVWARYGEPRNRARTAVRLDFNGHKWGKQNRWKQNKIRSSDYARFTPLQRLFADKSAVVP
jgi:hypothetical protein